MGTYTVKMERMSTSDPISIRDRDLDNLILWKSVYITSGE